MAFATHPARLFFAGSGGLALAALGVALSVGFHGGLAFAVLSLPKDQKREAHAIALHEAKKTPPKPAEPTKLEEKPKNKETSQQRLPSHAKSAPSPSKAEAPPPNGGKPSTGDGLPDFGLSLSGGTGTGGLAVSGGAGSAGPAEPSTGATSKKPQGAAPRRDDECTDALVRPKPTRQAQPAYNDGARADKIEGRVRIEVQVDERGKVAGARLLTGLGHGLDEAALAAVKQWSFEPASRCNKPVPHTIVVPFTFKIAP